MEAAHFREILLIHSLYIWVCEFICPLDPLKYDPKGLGKSWVRRLFVPKAFRTQVFFVPRRNEVAEGGYWITLRPSVRPSVRPFALNNFKTYGQKPVILPMCDTCIIKNY